MRVLDAGIPDRGMHAAAVDADALYYATDRAIYRQPLPPAGSTAPPANNDFEHAAPISGTLPLEVFGRTGYATLQPGEPTFEGLRRTVWYAYNAAADRDGVPRPDLRLGLQRVRRLGGLHA